MGARSSKAWQVADRIHSAAGQLIRSLRQKSGMMDLGGLARLSALWELVRHGPMSLKELAAQQHVQPPTMTRLVDALEKQGLLRRQAHEKDRRALRLEATPKGRRTVTKMRQQRIQWLAEKTGQLSPADSDLLLQAAELMEKLAQ